MPRTLSDQDSGRSQVGARGGSSEPPCVKNYIINTRLKLFFMDI